LCNADVLIVDDRTLDAEATIYALRRIAPQSKALRLRDASEALQYLFSIGSFSRHRPEVPRLVFLALELPVFNGICLLEVMRAHPATAGIPVVILSTEPFPRKHRRNDGFAADAYVTKRWDLTRYCALLEAIAGRHLPPRLLAAPAGQPLH
jgi:CheY-like chemotaxis protein